MNLNPQLKTWSVRLAKGIACGLSASVASLLAIGIVALNHKPDLKPWHEVHLDAEFNAKRHSDLSFKEYLELENRLFEQLAKRVCSRVAEEDAHGINRYHRGSLSDPERWQQNWNRSYELPVTAPGVVPPRLGVLLVHGLSDSPYSLRTIGARLHQAGAHVLALRLPGHGTAPAALAHTRWQDMAVAVQLAMRHLREQLGKACPLAIIGYSNGAALAIHYVLESFEHPGSLPGIDRLVLISPQIAVTPLAGFATWQARMGRVLGLRKLGWESVAIEYDPFKYASFPVNGAVIAHQLTGINRSTLTRLRAEDKLGRFPPALTFQSVVDATVSSSAVVEELFAKLPPLDRAGHSKPSRHELVAFDVNRTVESRPLLRVAPLVKARQILEEPDRSFAFTLLTNRNPTSLAVAEHKWLPGETQAQVQDAGLEWPRDVYSLSHVALPFAANDPLYGKRLASAEPPTTIQLGDSVLRGERGAIRIPASEILRQRWNPFYPYLENRILDWFGLGD